MWVEVIGIQLMSVTYIAHNEGRYIQSRTSRKVSVKLPEFRLFVHQVTGAKSGRLYIPACYLAEYGDRFKAWLELPHIEFDQSDLKLYDDGSIRLYFRSTELEYARCQKFYPLRHHWAA